MNSQPKIIPLIAYDKATDTATYIYRQPETIDPITFNGTTINSLVTIPKSGLSDTLIALEKPAVINYKIAAYEATTNGLLLAGAGAVASAVSAAGTNQGGATALTLDYNIITTAAASSGVVLPAITPYRAVIVINNGANALKIYGASTDFIGTTAGATGVTLAVGGIAVFYAKSTGVTNVSGKGWQQLV